MKTATLMSASAILFIVCLGGVVGQRISTIQLEGVQYFISRMNPYSPALNYFLAYQYCRSLGLQLTSFESKEKADGVVQYLKNAGMNKYDFWTSGNRLGTHMFLWMSTGLPFNATFDYMSKPEKPEEEDEAAAEEADEARSNAGSADGCVVLKAPTHAWATDDCTKVKDFICEQTRCYYYNYGSIPVSTAQGGPKEKTAAAVKLAPATEEPISTTSTTPAPTTPVATTAAPTPTTVEPTLPPLLNFTVQRRSSSRPHFAPTRERTQPGDTQPRREAVDNNRHVPRTFDGKNAHTNTNVVYVKAVGVKDGQTGWSLAYVDKNNATRPDRPQPTRQAVMLTRTRNTVPDPPADA